MVSLASEEARVDLYPSSPGVRSWDALCGTSSSDGRFYRITRSEGKEDEWSGSGKAVRPEEGGELLIVWKRRQLGGGDGQGPERPIKAFLV